MVSSSMSDLRNWLEGLGLEEYVETFDENKIDREVLTELTEDDLKDLGILLGHRKKLMQAIATLAPTASPASASAGYGLVGRTLNHYATGFCQLFQTLG